MSFVEFSEDVFDMWKNATNSTTFNHVVQKLQTAGNTQVKLKGLLSIETDLLGIEQLTDTRLLTAFLNTLGPESGDYFKDVKDNITYYLLRYATFRPKAPSIDTLQDVIKSMKSVKEISTTPQSLATLDSLSTFIKNYKSAAKDKQVIDVCGPIKTFICVDELIQELYSNYWQKQVANICLDPVKDSKPLEKWLTYNFVRESNVRIEISGKPATINDKHLKTVADQVIAETPPIFQDRHTVFKPFYGPIIQKITQQIFSSVAQTSEINKEILPTISINDALLSTLNPEMIFFFDFLIESVLNTDEFLSLTHSTVETFFTKATHSLENYLDKIQDIITKSNTCSFNPPTITSLLNLLVSMGLSQQTTKTYTDLLNESTSKKSPIHIKWSTFPAFMSALEGIISFSFYFYQLFPFASPTCQFFNIYTKCMSKLKDHAANGQSKFPGHTDTQSQNPILTNFLFFAVKVPVKEFSDIDIQLKSDTMKMFLWIYVERAWKYKQAKPDYMPTPLHDTTKTYTKLEVENYCKNINPGQVGYDKDLVRSPYFVHSFITLQVVPIFKEIMTNELPKNKSLYLLKWLIVFALQDTQNMFFIRRCLTATYFNIVDILNFNSDDEFVYTDLLNNIKEFIEETEASTGDRISFSTEFLAFLFTVQYTPVANKHYDIMQAHIKKSETLIQQHLPVMRISHTLCSAVILSTSSQILEIPVKDSTTGLSLSVPQFLNLIHTLYKKGLEFLNAFTESTKNLKRAYNQHLHFLNQFKAITTHRLKIKKLIPNFNEINNDFVSCLANSYNVTTFMYASSCYALKKHFEPLYTEPLISTDKIRTVLSFKEENSNNTNSFTKFLENHPEVFPPYSMQSTKISDDALSVAEVNFLQANFLPETLTSHDTTSHPKQKTYSSALDISVENINLDQYSVSNYEANNVPNPYILLDKQEFLSNLSL